VRPCPSCRYGPDECSYPGEAKPGCLRDKRIREDLNERLKMTSTKELRERIRQRAAEAKNEPT
jgi:hypothetical protein